MKAYPIYCLFLLWLPPCFATPENDAKLATQLVQQKKILPLSNLLHTLLKHKKGHLLDAKLHLRQQRYVYELFLTDEKGIIWEAEMDAQSGALLELHLNDLEIHHHETDSDRR